MSDAAQEGRLVGEEEEAEEGEVEGRAVALWWWWGEC